MDNTLKGKIELEVNGEATILGSDSVNRTRTVAINRYIPGVIINAIYNMAQGLDIRMGINDSNPTERVTIKDIQLQEDVININIIEYPYVVRLVRPTDRQLLEYEMPVKINCKIEVK